MSRKSTLFLMLMLSGACLAQNKDRSFNAAKIHIEWRNVENNYQGKPQFLSILKIINNAPDVLPAKGWKMYFNYARNIDTGSVESAIKIKHVNGGLFYLYPTLGFTGIKEKACLNITFLSSDWAVNYTDAPEGFFIVWDNRKPKVQPITDVKAIVPTTSKQYMRNSSDKVELTTSSTVYGQNNKTRDISIGSLSPIFLHRLFIEKRVVRCF